ncbi:MAG TPA: RNA polymerase sigma factor [Candidatus Paceibacterota bacterium]
MSIVREEKISQFERIFKDMGDAIFRHFYYQLGNRERAKELTQEVFMRTWQHLASGKDIRHEKAFLYTVAHNLFVNEIRAKRPVDSLDELTEATGYEIEDAVANPFTYSEQQELIRHLQRLPNTYREVLIMRYIEDMAVKDIAKLLHEKETNISMRIARGIQKLRSHYNKE